MLESMFITTFVINKTEIQLPAIQEPTHEAGASTKGKKFYSGAPQPGKIVDSYLKDHLKILLLKPKVLIRIGRGVIFFYPIIFLAFGTLGALSVYILAFHVFKPCPFIFLAFGISM